MKAVVVGAGLSGLTAARILKDKHFDVEVFEASGRLGGACADNECGEHLFGAHIFHTNNDIAWNFISRFGEIRPYQHRVLADVDKFGLIPIPYNRTSEEITGKLTDEEIINLVFRNYSKRQWGIEYDELPEEIRCRVKVRREGNDGRYFLDKYQGLPRNGYSEIFQNMADGITVNLDASKEDWKKAKAHLFIYTGSIDEAFGFYAGELPYRSLRFTPLEYRLLPCAVINNCTSGESKHTREYDNTFFAPGKCRSVIRETPCAYVRGQNTPYYPIPFGGTDKIMQKYKTIAAVERKTVFLGRLGRYKYLNMDAAIIEAIDAINRIAK